MKTKAEIFLEYETAILQADRLAEEAGAMKAEVSARAEEILTSLAGSWKGEAADVFYGKCGLLMEKAGQIGNSLNEAADAVRTIARNIYNAEMRALEIALTRE